MSSTLSQRRKKGIPLPIEQFEAEHLCNEVHDLWPVVGQDGNHHPSQRNALGETSSKQIGDGKEIE